MTDPDPTSEHGLASERSTPGSLRRSALVLLALVVVVVAVVALVPGLASLRGRFAGADLRWLLLAGAFQLCSCASYVIIFRSVFCRTSGTGTSVRIALAELAANSLFSFGGAGGLALGAWILGRGGMPGDRIARRTVAFFLLTSLANVTCLVVAGVVLASGLVENAPDPLLTLGLAAVGIAGVILALLAGRTARVRTGRVGHPRAAALRRSISEGVTEALALLRAREPGIPIGSLGYLLFDIAVLGAAFRAFDADAPSSGVLVMAYVIGQLGGLLPIPGGVGGVEGALVATFVLYGTGVEDATVAVLAYRGLLLVIPAVIGVPPLLSLQREISRDTLDVEPAQAVSLPARDA